MKLILRTPRLELVAATLEMVTADLHRRDELRALLDAEIGAGWPPPLVEARGMESIKQSLIADPMVGGWTTWYWVLRQRRILIGMSGFKTRPQHGSVEIGYTVLEQFQRRGLASEAIAAMTQWAFANGAETVFAETLPELIGSQRVLTKNGFSLVEESSEPGVIRFVRRRSSGMGL
jgi:[ribosomal protein S5]-alanine N-acetyltransferase